MAKWTRGPSAPLQDFGVFTVHGTEWLRDGAPIGRSIHTFATREWCNVVPITREGEVVLITQHRFGSDSRSIEIPGGLVDDGEEPIVAARRELREESGYLCEEIVALGIVRANPALQATRLHMFLATGCTLDPRGQALEGLEDCEVRVVSRRELDAMLRTGEIEHALVWTALLALRLYEETR